MPQAEACDCGRDVLNEVLPMIDNGDAGLRAVQAVIEEALGMAPGWPVLVYRVFEAQDRTPRH
jgi:hypothetical protein